MSKVVGILLAAGKSSRFGSNKCLALLPNHTAMGLHCAQQLSMVVDEMVCVIPPENQALQTLFSDAGFTTSICTLAAQGMSESLKAGVKHYQEDIDVSAFLIGLADMPLIKSSTYQSIADELTESGRIVLPMYEGKRGHPVGFNVQFSEALLTLQGDQGAKVLFQKHAKDITLINVDDPGIHQDVDTLSMFEQYFNDNTP